MSLENMPVLEHKSDLEHMPVLEHMSVLEHMPVLEEKNSVTGEKNPKIA